VQAKKLGWNAGWSGTKTTGCAQTASSYELNIMVLPVRNKLFDFSGQPNLLCDFLATMPNVSD
jgi:hypothetical protein